MRILKVEIAGFGKLHGLNLELAPKINVFWGGNEAGKSTFQQAILSLLYGFYEGTRATSTESEKWQKYRPWQGESYSGALEYVLDDGSSFRVERGFESEDIPTKVTDCVTGRDVTDDFGRGRHGNVPFAKNHLGMSKAVFASTGFINQGTITPIEKGQNVGDAIAALADTANPDVSATKAMQILDGLIRKIGTERSRTTPWASSKRDVEDAKANLKAYREAKDSIQQDAKEKDEFSEQLQKLSSDMKRTQISIVYKKISEIEDRLKRIAAQDKIMVEAEPRLDDLRKYADFPANLYQDVLKGRLLLQDVQERLNGLNTRMANKETELNQGNTLKEHQTLSATVGKLSEQDLQTIRDTQSSLDKLEFRINKEESSLKELGLQRTAVKPWLVVIMILLPPIGVPLFLWQRARARQRLLQQKAHKQGVLDSLLAEKRVASDNLQNTLRKYQVGDVDELFLKRVRYLELAGSVADYSSLKSQLGSPDLDVCAQRDHLIQVFRNAGIQETNFEKASALFDEAYNGKTRYDQIIKRYSSADTQKRQILGKQAIGELTEVLDALYKERDKILANNPQLTGLETDSTLEELDKLIADFDQKREFLEQEIVKRDERIRSKLSSHRDGAELEENLAQSERELSRLTVSRKALELTKQTIETAAGEIHREFAPQLGTAIGTSLAEITHGRYSIIQVDPTSLHISVRGAATDRTRTAEELSFGTTEQIYLLLRVELTRLMSDLYERVPLFFDDAFVNFDDTRLISTLRLLQRISEKNQIILFSKDKQIVDWFNSSLSADLANRLFTVEADGSIAERS